MSGQKPNNVPSNPHISYKGKGWISMGKWLGTETIATKNKEFTEYNEAKKIVSNFNIKTNLEWRNFTKSSLFPYNVPKSPEKKYKDEGWKGWADFLGK